MAATPKLRVVKSFTYRGSIRNFSNVYHFNGGTPANDSAWHTFMDHVTTAEKAIFGSEVSIVEAVGYAAGSDLPVSTKSYSLAGTVVITTTAQPAPGDCCALGRWTTTARTSKNHPVYLFNYWHNAYADYVSANEQDYLNAQQQTAMVTYMNAWVTGFSDGTLTLVRAGPNGATAVGVAVSDFITHRDFPR